MFRTISFLLSPLRSLPQTLNFITQPSLYLKPYHSPLKTTYEPIFYSTKSPIPSHFNPLFLILSTPLLQKKEDPYNDASLFNRDPKSPPKLFVVQPRLRPDTLLQAKLDEAINLANSLEEQRDGYYDTELCEKGLPPHVVVQNPAVRSSKYRSGRFLKLFRCRAWGKPVLDRVGLIIEIFNAHAQTKEAKLQAELAALMYKRTRLVRVRGPDGRYTFGATGETEVVSARGRGSGGRGFISGAGETELQLQRRRKYSDGKTRLLLTLKKGCVTHTTRSQNLTCIEEFGWVVMMFMGVGFVPIELILERRNHLLSQIEAVRRTRALQRASRKRRGGSNGQGLATVAIVGYTNAGKSTLVSALSESDLFSDDRLFATVDPRLRSVILPSGRKVLLSDTVGFISDLPVQLVEAFHATLEEVVEADLLVHVLDSSASDLDEQRSVVLQVLQQIGVSEEKLQNMLEVWNKIDLQEEEMGADKYLDNGEDDVVDSLSGAEDDDMPSELPAEPVDDDDEMILYQNCPLVMFKRRWMIMKVITLMVGCQEAVKGVKMTKAIPLDGRLWMINKCIPHVKTSAVMGVGLQELLALIDEKLETQKLTCQLEGSYKAKCCLLVGCYGISLVELMDEWESNTNRGMLGSASRYGVAGQLQEREERLRQKRVVRVGGELERRIVELRGGSKLERLERRISGEQLEKERTEREGELRREGENRERGRAFVWFFLGGASGRKLRKEGRFQKA
ncbi:GTP-binding protein, chloroplastic [Vitis vinifera]|uniref:GTP-binding protein, chloroplastic n=1 Tax=Vitis vinifera TaxID=29760 RepID=A0A438FC82_VITVI|nr:GTP-binding protein, chloroplastic [Vitis vinifera]